MTKVLKISLVAAGVAIIAIGIGLYRRNKPADTVNKVSSIIDEAKTEAKKIATSVDKKGYAKTTLERKAAIIGNGDLSTLPVSQSVLDSLRLDNLDKSARLQQASLVVATWQAKALRAIKQLDSLNNVQYVYKDDFASAIFTPDSLGGKFDLSYKIKLIRHDYGQRKNIFSPYVNYTDILSPDKRITIDGMQSISIESPKPSRFGFGLTGGGFFDPATKQFKPAIGAGIVYNIIPF